MPTTIRCGRCWSGCEVIFPPIPWLPERIATAGHHQPPARPRPRQRLAGLTDDEFFWEPAPGCWTIHRDESGAWISDYAEPDPDPAPFTTIGWRLLHIADCKVMYHEWAFGPRELSFPDLPPPPTADGALARLEEGHQLLRRELEGFADRALDEPPG
jgi:hypothetical protein